MVPIAGPMLDLAQTLRRRALILCFPVNRINQMQDTVDERLHCWRRTWRGTRGRHEGRGAGD
ncbi:hypothetical protein [Mesorhizobium sp. NFR06]|jgi:hypothetical protein|uniref:hypothetical protein n=1 Tax=Mesorhizobium sp. NFR06 TaxID=1566290 RepID=UPI00122D8C5B|nr:hypothetical protein [Mesorhizobium sp. NFR06]